MENPEFPYQFSVTDYPVAGLCHISAAFPAGIEVVWRASRTDAGVGRGGPEDRRRRYEGRSDRTEATADPAIGAILKIAPYL